ncbi:MAG: hypothetical protein EBR82_10080 [Caulobacteraceae bacterium]|nr:hypothetical protein [Caulobacteraceae bacterium]
MSKVAIIGRSPFVNKVDIEAIKQDYTTIGINNAGIDFETDYLFSCDFHYPVKGNTKIYLPWWVDGCEKTTYFKFTPDSEPIKQKYMKLTSKKQVLLLHYAFFTVTCAVNWALLQGFDECLLIGIDHSKQRFDHYDGTIDTEDVADAVLNDRCKEFLANCAPEMQCYQTNPDVAEEWPLPYFSLKHYYKRIY